MDGVPPGSCGDLRDGAEKNTLRQSGFCYLNMSFRKGFNVIGTQRLDFRVEAFHNLNRTRLGSG
jgi:hypothetical protein